LIVLSLGGGNHSFLRARLDRARDERGSSSAPSVFRRTIAAELVVALGLMGVSGVLVGQARTKEDVDVRPPADAQDAEARAAPGEAARVSFPRRP
jgi:hypothetical protein